MSDRTLLFEISDSQNAMTHIRHLETNIWRIDLCVQICG